MHPFNLWLFEILTLAGRFMFKFPRCLLYYLTASVGESDRREGDMSLISHFYQHRNDSSISSTLITMPHTFARTHFPAEHQAWKLFSILIRTLEINANDAHLGRVVPELEDVK